MVLGSTPTLSNTTYLNIDHGDPYEILTPANYTGEQTVGGTIDIKLKLVDKYGNLIDNKGPINPAHRITKRLNSRSLPPGRAGSVFSKFNNLQFTDQKQTLTVNDSGIIFTTLKVDTVPGDNIVWVRPLSPAPDDYFTVTGVANGEPWYIDQFFPTTEQPADGVQLFTFTYYLWDQYHNSLANKGINWTAKNISRG